MIVAQAFIFKAGTGPANLLLKLMLLLWAVTAFPRAWQALSLGKQQANVATIS